MVWPPEAMPETEKYKSELKPAFVKQYKEMLGDRYDDFIKYSFSWPLRSIRVNTIKKTVDEIHERITSQGWELDKVPWCDEGFFIRGERRDVGNLIEHTLGYIYIQEASSMLPPIVLRPEPGEIVLDQCAAPGSKTSQLAMYMKNQGVLIANDFKGDRLKPLGMNMQRMGVSNCVLTISRGEEYRRLPETFDKILVDAPCSGTGTIRKSLKTIVMWNQNMAKRLAGTQKALLESAFTALKPGGTLVYSTCTQEPLENENVISNLLQTHDNAFIEKIKLDITRSEPIREFDGLQFDERVKDCLRIYPMDNNSEGFFVTKIRKE